MIAWVVEKMDFSKLTTETLFSMFRTRLNTPNYKCDVLAELLKRKKCDESIDVLTPIKDEKSLSYFSIFFELYITTLPDEVILYDYKNFPDCFNKCIELTITAYIGMKSGFTNIQEFSDNFISKLISLNIFDIKISTNKGSQFVVDMFKYNHVEYEISKFLRILNFQYVDAMIIAFVDNGLRDFIDSPDYLLKSYMLKPEVVDITNLIIKIAQQISNDTDCIFSNRDLKELVNSIKSEDNVDMAIYFLEKVNTAEDIINSFRAYLSLNLPIVFSFKHWTTKEPTTKICLPDSSNKPFIYISPKDNLIYCEFPNGFINTTYMHLAYYVYTQTQKHVREEIFESNPLILDISDEDMNFLTANINDMAFAQNIIEIRKLFELYLSRSFLSKKSIFTLIYKNLKTTLALLGENLFKAFLHEYYDEVINCYCSTENDLEKLLRLPWDFDDILFNNDMASIGIFSKIANKISDVYTNEMFKIYLTSSTLTLLSENEITQNMIVIHPKDNTKYAISYSKNNELLAIPSELYKLLLIIQLGMSKLGLLN